jgi:hypothetical protein
MQLILLTKFNCKFWLKHEKSLDLNGYNFFFLDCYINIKEKFQKK